MLCPLSLREAVAVIEEDPTALITFGIAPTRPETGYGYIERGALLETRHGIPVNRVLGILPKIVLTALAGDSIARAMAGGAWGELMMERLI